MTDTQNTNSSNQSDISSKDRQSSSSTPPPETEVVFDIEDMARSSFSESPTDVVTFIISDEDSADS